MVLKKEIFENLNTAINWLDDDDNEGQHTIERVYSLSFEILNLVGHDLLNYKFFNRLRRLVEDKIFFASDIRSTIKEMKKETSENLSATENFLTVLDRIRRWEDKGLMKTVYVLSREILELIELKPSSVECGR